MNDTALLIFVGGILVNGKTAKKKPKKYNMLKLVKTHSKVVNAENKRQFHHFIKVVSEFLFGHLKFHFVVPENVQFGQKHPSLRAAAQSNIYGFITLICFGLSM